MKSLWEGLMLKKFREACLPWERCHTGAGAESEEEGAETECDKLTAAAIPYLPVLLRGRR